MSDEGLGRLNELLIERGRIYDAEGESQEWTRLGKEIDALKTKEGLREPIHST